MTDRRPFRLGLLWCGHVHPDALDVGGDYPELFADLFGPLGAEVVPFAVDRGELPASLDDCDGWITSPSRCSVNDPAPWIGDLRDLIGEAVRIERPFVGICFGHQLLATALGGRVERAAVGWGVGVQRYELDGTRWWMDPPPPSAGWIDLVASHEDQVTVVPTDARVLARADYCPIAGLEVGERAMSIQPHPEFTTDLSARLLDLREELIGPEIVARARATLGRPPQRLLAARWILRFLRGPGLGYHAR